MLFSRFLAAPVAAVFLAAMTAHAQDDSPLSTPTDVVVVPPADGDPVSVEPASDNGVVSGRVVQALVTGYANGADGGAVSDMTASGVHTHWGTVAADWRLYPLGTRLLIEGFPNVVFVVEDSGGGVHDNIFDVWFPDLASAVAFGTRSLKVTVLP